MERGVCGAPRHAITYVTRLLPGMPVFLYNFVRRELVGVLRAASKGGLNLDPNAWPQLRKGVSIYPAQVRVTVFLPVVMLHELGLFWAPRSGHAGPWHVDVPSPTRMWPICQGHKRRTCLEGVFCI